MNQCVPRWEVEENLALPPTALSNNISLPHDVPTIDYEVTELTWKDGQLAMHGFGVPKLPTKCSWEKPLAGGTLESIVNQATTIPSSKSGVDTGDELVRWFDDRLPRVPASSTPLTIDALSPCINNQEYLPGIGAGFVGSSTKLGSCSVATTLKDGRVTRLSHEWSSRINEQSMSGSGTRGRKERLQATSYDTCEREVGTTTGFTSTSFGSPGNTNSAKDCTNTVDDHDSACQSRNQRKEGKEEDKKNLTAKLSASGKRSRCAAVHNQSERKRRDKINERMRTLQKMVPNSCKTDKASMLDEVIEYLKQLQANVHMMNRMNMSTMMLPLALQQQLQMSMMSPMGMGMGMGMNMGMGLGVMDMNTIPRPNLSGILPPHVLHPNPFMPMPSWDIPADRLPPSSSSMPDPLSASFVACQSQPMTMDAYSRMAALYQQFQAPAAPASNS